MPKSKNQQQAQQAVIYQMSTSVMSNVKGRGQGVGRGWGRGQQKQNATVRGRGGRGARCAIGGWGQGWGWGNYNSRENNANAHDSNDGNYGPMVPMDVEDASLKTQVPTVVRYHRSFQCCEADNCQYR